VKSEKENETKQRVDENRVSERKIGGMRRIMSSPMHKEHRRVMVKRKKGRKGRKEGHRG